MENPIRTFDNEKCCKKQDWEEMDRDFGNGEGGETDNRIYIMYKCTQCGAKIMDIFNLAKTVKGWEDETESEFTVEDLDREEIRELSSKYKYGES